MNGSYARLKHQAINRTMNQQATREISCTAIRKIIRGIILATYKKDSNDLNLIFRPVKQFVGDGTFFWPVSCKCKAVFLKDADRGSKVGIGISYDALCPEG